MADCGSAVLGSIPGIHPNLHTNHKKITHEIQRQYHHNRPMLHYEK